MFSDGGDETDNTNSFGERGELDRDRDGVSSSVGLVRYRECVPRVPRPSASVHRREESYSHDLSRPSVLCRGHRSSVAPLAVHSILYAPISSVWLYSIASVPNPRAMRTNFLVFQSAANPGRVAVALSLYSTTHVPE